MVGAGEVWRSADAEVRQKAADVEAAQLSHGKPKVRVFEETAEPVTKGAGGGPRRRMYFFVLGQGDGGGPVALERYEPASQTLERLSMSMPTPGRGTMAAGRDGLYVAAYSAKQGIWRFTWEQLQGRWTPVEAGVSGGGEGAAPGAAATPKPKTASGARTAATKTAKAPAEKQSAGPSLPKAG